MCYVCKICYKIKTDNSWLGVKPVYNMHCTKFDVNLTTKLDEFADASSCLNMLDVVLVILGI